MNSPVHQINLVFAWLGIVLGFAAGSVLGVRFHDDQWLGGYGSFPRRLYRLAHISLFGLAVVNFLFYLTARNFPRGSAALTVASWGFVLGAVSMPVCCLLLARRPGLRALFLLPIVSLIGAGSLTLWRIIAS